MYNILITSAGQRVSLVRAFQQEVKKINLDAKVYTVDLNPRLAPACHVSDGYKQVKYVTEENYIEELLQICLDWKIQLLIPTIDTELLVLAANKQLFLENGIVPIVSSLDFVQKCRDKRITKQFFKENNIDSPKDIDKSNPVFPLFIKPYDGSLSKDTFLIRKASELTDYHFQNPKFMFMEYIDHNQFEEYTVDTYYNKYNELKCIVPRKRILVRSGEVNKGVTDKNEIVTYVKKHLSEIKGAVGCLTMQFFFHPATKKIVGIEINPRFGGGFPLSYLSGANYPLWLIKEYLLDEEIPFFMDWEDKMLMLRYDDEVIIHNYNG
ncbi:ATP-grasp domain-containing protein [Flavobacterium sp.]|uniref:ATP-grasp domain-containing protein n=1 Tax=Flavobacterium sp. TaxID=239 RepID=UPI002B4B8C33|nr:ATP-grasp domain-containing protein [Flavobacterium sp.]HLF51193.1 ATP-grasp domain-containing protein [Flavobacterium sp.]